MSSAADLFIEEARAVSIAEAAERLGVAGLKPSGTGESVGPCPTCGGTDRFSINTTKNAWNCRGSVNGGGRDAISLAAHLGGHAVKGRDGFLAACADVLGRQVPDGEPETEGARAAREARLAQVRAVSAAKAARQQSEAGAYRDRERAKARGKWGASAELAAAAGTMVRRYLALRLGGHALPALPFLRALGAEPYWQGDDEAGRSVAIHEGPAMVAPFVDPQGAVMGCHLTWIDLAAPKARPLLRQGAEPLATKKMRGSKMGGLIPLVGWSFAPPLSGKPLAGASGDRIVPEPGRTRLVIGEGIENTLAVGIAEGFRRDTLYAAAGDLGNLAGPADPKCNFAHPSLTRPDVNGKLRALRVQGPVPKPGQGPGDAVQVPGQVDELLLIADGDSEPFATGAAMLRAKARLETAHRVVAIAWPPAGADFADLLTRRSEAA
ncbi:hypothetical protein GTW51_14895 [Aurantimonas aggregata]|uniref:DUF7146 domain-containing protein n=1 Tax=Aurantimonas aggregata TaxID=2047720 RepID=A0A6L9MKH7_9HYPH|nr:hypothetical protein [Aurantimonas aggregata]